VGGCFPGRWRRGRQRKLREGGRNLKSSRNRKAVRELGDGSRAIESCAGVNVKPRVRLERLARGRWDAVRCCAEGRTSKRGAPASVKAGWRGRPRRGLPGPHHQTPSPNDPCFSSAVFAEACCNPTQPHLISRSEQLGRSTNQDGSLQHSLASRTGPTEGSESPHSGKTPARLLWPEHMTHPSRFEITANRFRKPTLHPTHRHTTRAAYAFCWYIARLHLSTASHRSPGSAM
jgi:hypothetical protein